MFELKQRHRTKEKHELWAIAFCPDSIYLPPVDTNRTTTTTTTTGTTTATGTSDTSSNSSSTDTTVVQDDKTGVTKKTGDTTKNNKEESSSTHTRTRTRNSVQYNYFATVGGTKAYIYEYQSRNYKEEHSHGNTTCSSSNKELLDRKKKFNFNLRQLYTSSHPEEDFYSVTFANRRSQRQIDYNNNNNSNNNNKGDGDEQMTTSSYSEQQRILCVGGATKEILLIDIQTGKLHAKLTGNIGPILDLKAICCESNNNTTHNNNNSRCNNGELTNYNNAAVNNKVVAFKSASISTAIPTT